MTAFSVEISDHPVSFSELDILQLQRSSLCPSEAATDQDSDHGTVSPLFGGERAKCVDQAPALFDREPVADADAEPTSALYSADTSSQIRTEEATMEAS